MKRTIEDSFRHKGMRKKLIKVIQEQGIRDKRVLAAMEQIPRHVFMDEAFVEFAYQNKPFPIGSGQTISQPYTVAFQSELLEVEPGMKVLEVGTGSGYQACVLAEMGAEVYTIERIKALFDKAKRIIKVLGYTNVRTIYGDGYEGMEAFAPFDRILVTAAAPEVPKKLLGQLKVGGLLVIPEGEGGLQRMLRISRLSEDQYETESFDYFSFVPMLKGLE